MPSDIKRWIIPAQTLLLGFACLGLLFCGCKKKDRLTASTFQFSVTPPAKSLLISDTLTLNAHGSSAGGSVDVSPTWTVSPPTVGTLSPEAGSTVVFDPSTLGDVVITATYGDMVATSKIAVVSYIPTASAFSVYTDRGLPAEDGILSNLFLRIDGSCNPLLTVTPKSSGYTPEGITYLNTSDFDNNDFWGITLDSATAVVACGLTPPTNGFSKDLSSFTGGTLNFSLRLGRALAVGETLNINVADQATTFSSALVNGADGYSRLSTEWQEISIPLTRYIGVDFNHIVVPFAVAGSGLASILTFDVDAVRWTH